MNEDVIQEGQETKELFMIAQSIYRGDSDKEPKRYGTRLLSRHRIASKRWRERFHYRVKRDTRKASEVLMNGGFVSVDYMLGHEFRTEIRKITGKLPTKVFEYKSKTESLSDSGMGEHIFHIFGMDYDKFDLSPLIAELNAQLHPEDEISQDFIIEFLSDKSKHYKLYKICKNCHNVYGRTTKACPKCKATKARKISEPTEQLKNTLYAIRDAFLSHVWATDMSHGFIAGRSPKTNAGMHLGCKVLVKIDIKEFFDHITVDMVEEGYLNTLPKKMLPYARLLAELSTFDLHKAWNKKKGCPHVTPQGSPISPILSNVILRLFDMRMAGFARKVGFCCTRYADDIVLSAVDNRKINKTIPFIKQLLRETGFQANEKKVVVKRSGQRMTVTGIVVNDTLNVPRKERRNFRAKLHKILSNEELLKSVTDKEIEQMMGYANWIKHVNPTTGEKFVSQIKTIIEKRG